MDRLQAILQVIKAYLQQIRLSETRRRIEEGLYQQRRKMIGGVLVLIMLAFLLGNMKLVTLEGEAMGVSYKIQYLDRWGRNYQKAVEVLLGEIDRALSTAVPDSELSRFNAHDCTEFYLKSPFFYPVFAKSKEVYRNTAGAFDPTILPLVNAREDNPNQAADLNQAQVDKLHEYISLDYVVANEQRIKRLKEGAQLDFGGILKGYAVDQVVELLRAKGIDRVWMVLGNDLVVRGKRRKRKHWAIPIHPYMPTWGDSEQTIKVKVINKAVAISSRQTAAHPERIVDPAPGTSKQHRLLAAVVIAPDCISADAYATAMMVRGLTDARELVEKQEELAAFLVYEDNNEVPAFYTSPGLLMQQNKHGIILTLDQQED